MTKLINLTPHSIRIYDNELNIIAEVPSSGAIARVKTERTPTSRIELDGHDIPVVEEIYDGVVGLPDPVPGYVFIISAMVGAWVRRDDVVSPDTSPESVVRDKKGFILGVKGFRAH